CGLGGGGVARCRALLGRTPPAATCSIFLVSCSCGSRYVQALNMSRGCVQKSRFLEHVFSRVQAASTFAECVQKSLVLAHITSATPKLRMPAGRAAPPGRRP